MAPHVVVVLFSKLPYCPLFCASLSLPLRPPLPAHVSTLLDMRVSAPSALPYQGEYLQSRTVFVVVVRRTHNRQASRQQAKRDGRRVRAMAFAKCAFGVAAPDAVGRKALRASHDARRGRVMTRAIGERKESGEDAAGRNEGSNARKMLAVAAAGVLLASTALPQESLAARSGGRAGGRAFRSAPRAAPRPSAGSSRMRGGPVYTAPPLRGGYGYGGYGYGGFGMPMFAPPIFFGGGKLKRTRVRACALTDHSTPLQASSSSSCFSRSFNSWATFFARLRMLHAGTTRTMTTTSLTEPPKRRVSSLSSLTHTPTKP